MEQLKKLSSIFSEEFLSERLTNWFQKDVLFKDVKFLGEAGSKGDSYLSDVYRVVIYGRTKSPQPDGESEVSVQIVLKVFPASIVYRKTFRSHVFFKNEINFYNIIVPELLKFQAEKKIKDPFTNLPRMFAAVANGVDDIVMLEDLSLYDYSMPVRQENIDPDHINIIMDTFAKYHALSFAFKDQNPEKYEELTTHIMEVYYNPIFWDWYKGFWKLLCSISLDAIHKEHPNTIYEEKVKEFASEKTFYRAVKAAMEKRDTAVIGHGDSWTPNFLFQYENNKPTKSMMIDFQLARSASPILDVSFFIYACGSGKNYLENNYDAILKYYYDRLTAQIRDLGSDPDKIYPWKVFMDEIKELSFFGAAFAMESTPVIVLEPEEAMGGVEIEGENAVPIETIWALSPIKSKKGRERLCDIFVHAVNKGYL